MTEIDSSKCGICFQDISIKRTVVLKCEHSLHRTCFVNLCESTHLSCPVCPKWTIGRFARDERGNGLPQIYCYGPTGQVSTVEWLTLSLEPRRGFAACSDNLLENIAGWLLRTSEDLKLAREAGKPDEYIRDIIDERQKLLDRYQTVVRVQNEAAELQIRIRTAAEVMKAAAAAQVVVKEDAADASPNGMEESARDEAAVAVEEDTNGQIQAVVEVVAEDDYDEHAEDTAEVAVEEHAETAAEIEEEASPTAADDTDERAPAEDVTEGHAAAAAAAAEVAAADVHIDARAEDTAEVAVEEGAETAAEIEEDASSAAAFDPGERAPAEDVTEGHAAAAADDRQQHAAAAADDRQQHAAAAAAVDNNESAEVAPAATVEEDNVSSATATVDVFVEEGAAATVIVEGHASAEQKVSEEELCGICFEGLLIKRQAIIEPCQHSFHRTCILKWLEQQEDDFISGVVSVSDPLAHVIQGKDMIRGVFKKLAAQLIYAVRDKRSQEYVDDIREEMEKYKKRSIALTQYKFFLVEKREIERLSKGIDEETENSTDEDKENVETKPSEQLSNN